MGIVRYIVGAAAVIVAVFAFYINKFHFDLGYGFSDDSAVWGQFGDYMGGSLNPILSFISIVLLLKSLGLQSQSNLDLREELEDNRKAEKLRFFSALFFNMISSQKNLLDSFAIRFSREDVHLTPGVNSIIFIEDEIHRLRSEGAKDQEIIEFLDGIDADERIYGILRGFYITVKIVSDKLSEANGFSIEDRHEYFVTLINFTDFSQLRLIAMAVQFFDAPPSAYLRAHAELKLVLEEVGLGLNLY